MSKSIYIATSEKSSGKSFISLGLMEALIKRYSRVAYFRPIISDHLENKKEKSIEMIAEHLGRFNNRNISYEDTFALTFGEAYELLSKGNYTELIERVILKYRSLVDRNDFVVCEGTSFKSVYSAYELSLNARMAKDLGTPVLAVISGADKNYEEIIRSIRLASDYYNANGVNQAGSIVNRLPVKYQSKFDKDTKNSSTFIGSIPDDPDIRRGNALFVKLFKDSIDSKKLVSKILDTPDNGTSYKMFEYNIRKKAKDSKKHIVLPEGEDKRILQAAKVLIDKGYVDLTILGDLKTVEKNLKELNITLNVKIIDTKTSDKLDSYAETLYQLRKHKGLSQEDAKKLVTDPSYFGTMMVYTGDADGMVSGAIHTTGDTVRPALQIVKTSKDCSIVSSVFFMCLDGRVVIYGDCAVNPNPTPTQLAEIAITSAKTAKSIGIDPKIAFLSYSTGDSGSGPDVDAIKEAISITKAKAPSLPIDGPMQYDAAVNQVVAKLKFPNSSIAGNATVMIFPDLNTGNITYKAVQRESNSQAIGPMLQGLNRPINDLSRGCSVDDIINTVIITAIQAQKGN